METTNNIVASTAVSPDRSTPRDLTREVPRQAQGLRVMEAGGALTVSNPATGSILMTNKVGGKILDLVDGTRNVAGIWELLSGNFRRSMR